VLNVRIRPAAAQDSEELVGLADELIRLDNRSGREAMLEKSLQAQDCRIYVAEVDDRTVGFVEVRVFPDFVEGGPIAVIQNLIVGKNHRKLGIGSKLLEAAIEEARDRKALEIHVWTESDNQPAISFYSKHEFKKRALLLEKET